jgi:GNAT superfamily N-acetyltransferase
LRVSFEKADFDALAELWKGCFIEQYHVDAALLKANTVDSPVFDWGASCIEIDGGKPTAFVAVKKSAAPKLYKGPDPDQAHLTALAYEDPMVGIDLMAHTKSVLRNRGVYKLLFGQDSRHIFPGCPAECTALRDFLIIEGFQEHGEVLDFERDLDSYEPPASSLESLKTTASPEGGKEPQTSAAQVLTSAAEVRPVTLEELPLLRIFLNREFPGRWAYDVLAKIETEGRPEMVYGLFVNKACEGFALTQDASHVLPIGGAIWRQSLGDNWASLGPIGVSKAKRGQGYGDALLAATLTGLRERGRRRCIVDWTTLTDFYGRHGFEVSRRYRQFTLRLDSEEVEGPTLFGPGL